MATGLTVRFVCGHQQAVPISGDHVPVCPCGERQIARTQARAPRFTGACSGPYAEQRLVDPAVVNVAPHGPLVLKES